MIWFVLCLFQKWLLMLYLCLCAWTVFCRPHMSGLLWQTELTSDCAHSEAFSVLVLLERLSGGQDEDIQVNEIKKEQ